MTSPRKPPVTPNDFFRLKRIFTRTYEVPAQMSFEQLIAKLSTIVNPETGALRDWTVSFFSGTPADVLTSGTGTPGAGVTAARGDHAHGIELDGTAIAVFDGGGSVLNSAEFVDLEVDFACTITAARLLADQAGDAVVDVRRSTYAGFPGSLASICASAKPTLSAVQKSQDTTLTGWTTALASGDILRVYLESVATIQQLTLALKVRRT